MGEATRRVRGIRGPMCSTRCGPGWIDDGTTCRRRSYAWGPIGIERQTKRPKTPTVEPANRSVQRRNASERAKSKMPPLEDCRKKMQSNLPKAHKKAIDLLNHTIGFFEKVFGILLSSSSIENITTRLGIQRIRFLTIYWGIYIDPRIREMKGLEIRPSRLHIAVEILHPVSRILSVYKTIKAGLQKGEFNYECEYMGDFLYKFRCDGSPGYVHSAFGKPFGDIHICVDKILNMDDIEDIALMIIQEASHKFAGTDDDSKVPWENAHDVEQGVPTHYK